MELKTCSICNDQKPLTAFYPKAGAKDGRMAHCMMCQRRATKDSFDKDPEKYRAVKRARYDEGRAVAYRAKPALDLARTMAVMVSVVKDWRDHDPAKFTEFKNLLKGRVMP